MAKKSPERQQAQALEALKLYQLPMSIREVAEQLQLSYGTTYALIKLAGGSKAFRPRGTRVQSRKSDVP